MATEEEPINLRLPADRDRWGEVERVLLQVFNTAWDALSEGERAEQREERDGLLNGYSGGTDR